MKKVVVSAPGKLHLSGEHAVVYGRPAVVVATSDRTIVTLTSKKADKAILLKETSANSHLLKEVIASFTQKKDFIEKIWINIESSVAQGAGMGSSAAVAAALAGALLIYSGQKWDLQKINEIAYKAEKVQHLSPSGSDNTIATFGGLLWYRKEFEFLKTFWLLPFKFPRTFTSFVVINTGRSETTGEMVKMVSMLPIAKRKKIFDEIELTTKQILQAIHDEDQDGFYQAIKSNEVCLEELNVVSKSTKNLICEIEDEGGFGKISGAGGLKTGSGTVLATHKNLKKLVQIAQKHGYSAHEVQLGGVGTKLEQVTI